MGIDQVGDDSWLETREDERKRPATEPRRWWGWAALVLSLAGFGDSLYLTIEHFSGGILNCPETGGIDCWAVTHSPQAEVFGVLPVALLGLIFYTVLTAINLPPLWRRRDEIGRWLSYARLASVITGIGFVFYLLYTELFSIKKICLYCTGVHVLTFLLFALVVSTLPTMLATPGLSER